MRQFREWQEASRQKLSASTKGKAKSPQTKAKISQSMTKYWQSVPSKPNEPKIAEDDTLETHFAPQPNRRDGQPLKVRPMSKAELRRLELLTNPPVPPEPVIKNDFGIWEEITRDLITYQGEGSARNGNNKRDRTNEKCSHSTN